MIQNNSSSTLWNLLFVVLTKKECPWFILFLLFSPTNRISRSRAIHQIRTAYPELPWDSYFTRNSIPVGFQSTHQTLGEMYFEFKLSSSGYFWKSSFRKTRFILVLVILPGYVLYPTTLNPTYHSRSLTPSSQRVKMWNSIDLIYSYAKVLSLLIILRDWIKEPWCWNICHTGWGSKWVLIS